MVRLVEKYHPDLLQQTHQHLASVPFTHYHTHINSYSLQLLERDNQFTQAEQHYTASRDAKVIRRHHNSD